MLHVHKSDMVAMAAVCDFGFELVDHPPYSPDLAPSDYFLFLNTKKNLAETQYTDTDTHTHTHTHMHIHTTYTHKHTCMRTMKK